MLARTLRLVRAAGRRIQTALILLRSGRLVTAGAHIHIGHGTRIWAPDHVTLGSHIYIGKDVHIEANCRIGDFCLIANRVALIGRNDHDFRAVGYPVRYSPWIGSTLQHSRFRTEEIVIDSDVWIGFGAILLTKVHIGRGAVISAGSVVVRDVEPYAIVAGNPAKTVGHRFNCVSDRQLHEQRIMHGTFKLSEIDYDRCVVKPGESSCTKH